MDAEDQTIEESDDDSATLEPEWDPFGDDEENHIGDDGITSSQCKRNTIRYTTAANNKC